MCPVKNLLIGRIKLTLNILINVPADSAGKQRLEAMDVNVTDVTHIKTGDSSPCELDPAMLARQHVILCEELPASHQVMTQLKMLQLASAGYGQILKMGLPERGVQACNASGVFDTAIAEWCIAMMINTSRDLRTMIRHQEQGVWDRSPIHQQQIRGRVVGFWGYGGLARETARLCKAMGMNVHVLTRKGVKPMQNRYVVQGTGDVSGTLPDHVFMEPQKREFLAGLDFLVMAMPLSDATRGICSREDLQALPRHAIVLNPARGPLIHEAALLEALREKWITAAALDTHYYYPMPAEHPLWHMDNVIMTPHISGSSDGDYFLPRLWEIFTENLRRLLANKPLLNELPAASLT